MQVLLGLLLETGDGGAVGLRLRLRGQLPRHRSGAGRRAGPGARARPAARRHRPRAARPARRPAARGRPRRPDLRRRPVHPADDAGRGLPVAARHAHHRGHPRQRRLRVRGGAGGAGRRPRRHPAGAHRRPRGDRGRRPHAGRDRPLPPGGAHPAVAAGDAGHVDDRAGPGPHAGRHRQGAHLRPRGHARAGDGSGRRGHGRVRGWRAAHDLPPARGRVPQVPLACSRARARPSPRCPPPRSSRP